MVRCARFGTAFWVAGPGPNARALSLRTSPARRPIPHCLCARHRRLADLLSKLSAFERDSLDCESANVKDAAMHATMYSTSGHCREFLEEMLRRLMANEGIPEPRRL